MPQVCRTSRRDARAEVRAAPRAVEFSRFRVLSLCSDCENENENLTPNHFFSMNPERARIQADLRGLMEGEVFCDDLFLQMYATDASILQIKPMGVVRPRSTSDVVACVQYAAENHLSLHARGSGSNVVGAAIGPGIIIDFSHYMRRVIPLSDQAVRVGPGVVLAELNRQLARRQQMFGPDPATRSVTTMGGVIAMNSAGSHWIKYGAPREKIRRLQLVLADAQVVEVGSDAATSPRVKQLEDRVDHIVGRRRELIEQHQPQTKINHAGYDLTDLTHDGRIDLTRLIAGSEGTLAIITEATVETQPVPKHRGVILFFFDSLDRAMPAALEIIKKDVAACDLMDRRLLSIARKADKRFARLIPEPAEAMLLVELQADTASGLRQQLQFLNDRITRRKRMAFDARITSELEQRNLYWRIVRRIVPMQFGLGGGRQALPFVDDIAVMPEQLPVLISDVHSILNRFEVTASVFAHVGQGLLHLRPQLNLADESDSAKIADLSEHIFNRVFELGGSISGNHGDGLVRTPYLRRQYSKLYDVFVEIKRAFDPQNILNPGKIVDSPPIDVWSHLRSVTVLQPAGPEEVDDPSEAGSPNESNGKKTASRLTVIEPQLTWDLPQMAAVASKCNGCARCRTNSPDERMCPIFRLAPREESSPRAKANLVRALVSGQLSADALNDEDLKSIADLCVNCHQCRLECPAHVDIPKLMIETKAQYVAVNGLKMSQWLLTRLDILYGIAGRSPRLINWMIRNGAMRWVLDRFFGIALARKLPGFTRRPFLRWAHRQRLTQAPRRQNKSVLYFVDAFANWNDDELARATCAVLKHNGFEVYVPPNQQIAGMSLISAGLIDRAKRIAAKNVEILAEGVRNGCHIVTTEPSAALALKHEYLNLMDDDDARMVAENTTDISNFLWNLHLTGDLELDFRPLNCSVGYHLPCHQRALGETVAAINLLNLIPGMQIERIEKGCSGMAGIYGLMRSNYRRSLRAGVGLISAMRSPQIMVGATECSTCKIQMEQGTLKPTIHPVKILALAYRLMPELNNLFDRRSEELVIS